MIALEKVQADSLALSVASEPAVANEAAVRAGTDPRSSLLTISQESTQTGQTWRIHYGPIDYIGRRGGDLTVFVGAIDGEIQRILRGQ